MKKFAITILLFAIIAIPKIVFAQIDWPTFENLFLSPRNYVIHFTHEMINIDGFPNESAWKKAEWTDHFVDIEGPEKPKPTFQTKMKMLWNEQNIYFLIEMEEPHIWAYYEEHDKIVYHENDFEIFIDPDGDTHNYFEFEFNARNTLFDLFMTRPYRNGGIPLISWNATGIESSVSVDGTLNNPNDTDKKWILEVAIPFEDLRLGVYSRTPKDGEIWRINFSRVQWQTEIVNGKYIRKKNEETGRLISENNWVWSPIGIINMHYPERWGYLQFSSQLPGSQVKFTEPEDKKLRNHLWRIYYKQFHHRHKKGKFANSLKALSEGETIKINENITMKFELQATDYQFILIAKTSDGMKLTINNYGRISTHKNR
jgi:hypothetical protein